MRSSRSANLERMSRPLSDLIRFRNEYLTVSAWELKENPGVHDTCLNNRGQCESELVQVSISLGLTSIFHFPVGLAARTDFLSPQQAELERRART
jgi:hypothetical protein